MQNLDQLVFTVYPLLWDDLDLSSVPKVAFGFEDEIFFMNTDCWYHLFILQLYLSELRNCLDTVVLRHQHEHLVPSYMRI